MTLLLWIADGLVFLILGWLLSSRFLPVPKEVAPEIQEIVIQVENGFLPETVVLRRSIATKIRVMREEDTDETTEIFIPHFVIHRKLPPFKTTTIDLDPDEPGVYEFHSKGGVYQGRIVVV